MANRRMISKALTLSKQLNHVSLFSQELFVRIVAHADDWGRLTADPEVLLGLLWPICKTVEIHPGGTGTITVNEAMIDAGLHELSNAKDSQGIPIVLLYEDSGEWYLWLPKWDAHQGGLHKRTPSKYPDPPPVSENFREVPGNSRPIEQNRREHEQNRREENGADAPALRPLARTYIETFYPLGYPNRTTTRIQSLNRQALDIEKHPRYQDATEEGCCFLVRAFAEHRLDAYREANDGKTPSLGYIGKAIAEQLDKGWPDNDD